MKFRHAVVVLAAVVVAGGCSVPEPTAQTSMLRGATPSPGLAIPPLLRASGSVASADPSGATGDSFAPDGTPPAASDTAQPPAESPAAPTDQPGAGDPAPPTTDEFGTGQPDSTATDSGAAGAGGPNLAQIAASAGCTDYAELDPPDPGSTTSAACTVDNQQVLLYSFATPAMAAAFADSLSSSGVTVDQLLQGSGYLVWADAGPIAKIKAALGAG
jgi:hypothetical protein